MYTTTHQPVIDMNCSGDDCNVGLNIPGTMLEHHDGKKMETMLQTGGSVTVEFLDVTTPGFYFIIDEISTVRELGWLKYPDLKFMVWEAQYLEYMSRLRNKISQNAVVINVFNEVQLGGKPIYSVVQLPALDTLKKYGKVELDLALSCTGRLDADCPAWDRVLQVDISCQSAQAVELGRWITPFRRRVGRWLTDITPFVPLITSSTCNFTIHTDPWLTHVWVPTLNIRLSNFNANPKAVPYKLMHLYDGGEFNQTYNKQYNPILFSVPDGVVKVELVAVITGHGSDSNNCGEFCVSSHHFIVNGHPHVLTFSDAGTPFGCANRAAEGAVPNEHGTWLYGRGGWCDGLQVSPWVVDVTNELQSGTNSVNYFGWYDGHDPDPTSGFSEILMHSYLAFWKHL